MTTRAQKANQELGGEIGAYGGLAAGAVGGRYAAHGASKAKQGVEAAKTSHRFSRQLAGATKQGGRLARLKDVGTAVKTGGAVARHAPSRALFSSPAGMAIGAGGGMFAGYKVGEKAVAAHQAKKKVKKSMTMDEIAKRTQYEMNPKADPKEAQRHGLAALGSMGAAFTGSAAYGHKAGGIGAERTIGQALQGKKVGARGALKNLGTGYKTAIKTKQGKIGAGLAAAGVAGQMATSHSAKKKGIVRPKKVQKSAGATSAFGIEH